MKEKKTLSASKIKPTKRDYLKLTLVFVFILVFFNVLINYLSYIHKKKEQFIDSNYGLIKAKIVNKSTYKGSSLTVVYKVNDIFYRESDVVSKNDLEVGDSILIKYSKTNPELIMIDLE